MKKSITNKIEALLFSLYGVPLPKNKMASNSQRAAESSDLAQGGLGGRRCKNLPFEFIRLLF
jgi:hypothetical protein